MANKKDLLILGFIFIILMCLFIFLDISHENSSCFGGYPSLEKVGESLDFTDVYCIVNAEVYEPFIYLFASLWLICWVWVGSLWVIDQIRK